MTDTEKVALCKMLLENYYTYADHDCISAVEMLARDVETVMNFEEDKHATD